VDFARAVVSLGVDRGLDEFQRFGFQVRNGLSYFATPLTRIVARRNPSVDLLSDVDAWLDRFRRAAIKDTAPASARRALSVLEARILDLCASRSDERLLRVFIALGQCEAMAARSLKWATESFLQPLCGLRREWLDHGWNGEYGREFRLAASLASLTQSFGKKWLPFRCHLEPVDSFYNKNKDTITYRWTENPTNDAQWSQAPLTTVLNNIFARRLLKTPDKDKFGGISSSLADIKAFIEGDMDDSLLSDLLWSMSLINWRKTADLPHRTKEPQPVAPTFYALLKLCFPPVRDSQPEHIQQVPAVPAIHRHAAQGNGTEAAAQALRRLRASGYHPKITRMPVQGDHAKRTAAALLFPISDKTLAALQKQTERPEEEAKKAAITHSAE
jgi:CRISPR-associated protein Csx17